MQISLSKTDFQTQSAFSILPLCSYFYFPSSAVCGHWYTCTGLRGNDSQASPPIRQVSCVHTTCTTWYKITVYVLIEAQCASASAWVHIINFHNKACHPVPTICMYTVNRNRVDLCLQGSGDLGKCGSQTERNTARF